MLKKLHTKITTLVIALAMIASMFAMPTMAEEATADYSEALSALQSFGILTDEAADPAAQVTRGAFVSVITKIFGIELSENYPAAAKFSDVFPEDKIFTAVSVATDLGLISGYGDGTFRPDEPITKTQAVKILITLLGYEPVAGTYGGYPSGYLTVAAMVDLVKGVSLTGAEECLWGEAAQMLYNALEVDLMKNAKYPIAEYHVIEGSHILNSWLHIYKTEGLVQANDITSLNQAAGVPEGRVKIAGSIFIEGETYASGLLGYNVKAFYKENENSQNQLVFVVKNPTFDLEQISSKDIENPSLTEISYYDKATGKVDKFEISSAALIYNNKWIPRDGDAVSRLNPAEGNIKFLDNNRDGVIDVVFVEEYTVYFVNSVNSASYTITDKYSDNRLELDPENKELDYEIIKAGEPVDFSAITANSVLSVIKSPVTDGKVYVQVIIGTERFSGEITELGTDTVYIDGEEFEIFTSVRDEVEKLNLLDKSLFYLTYDNKIAGYGTVVTTGTTYGYVTAAGCVKKPGIGSENIGTLRMFSIADGKLVNYDTAEKLSINGNLNDGAGNPYNGRKLIDEFLGGSNNIEHQLIQFQLNEKGEIKAVNFVTDSSDNGIGYDLEDFSLDYQWETTRWDSTNSNYHRFYKSTNGGMFDNRYFSGNGTVLEIPVDESGNLIDEELITIPTLEDDVTYKLIEVYDSDEKNNAAVIILRTRTTASAPTGGAHFVIDKVTTTTTADGLQVKKLYGYYGATYKGILVAETAQFDVTTVNTLKRGDIVRVALDVKGEITNLVKLFTIAENPYVSEFKMNSGGYNDLRENFSKNSYFRLNSENVSSHIRVIDTNGSIVFAMFDQVRAVIPVASSAPVVIYDEKTDTLTQGAFTDIVPNDPRQSIVIRTTWGVTNQIYIINRINEYYPTWQGYVDATTGVGYR